MDKENLEKTLKHFEFRRKGKCSHFWLPTNEDVDHYMDSETDFGLYVFPTGEVYQSGSEADTVGTEILDYEKLKIRYESWTGEKLK